MASGSPKKNSDGLSRQLFINFQKLFRCMDFGRSLRGKSPTLTVRQMQVLSFFNEGEELHISDVSRRLNMSIQSVNNLVKRLEVMGYVERSKNGQDKRLSDVRFTKKGRDGFETFRAVQVEFLSSLLGQLDRGERDAVLEAVSCAAELFQKAIIGLVAGHTQAGGTGAQKAAAPAR